MHLTNDGGAKGCRRISAVVVEVIMVREELFVEILMIPHVLIVCI